MLWLFLAIDLFWVVASGFLSWLAVLAGSQVFSILFISLGVMRLCLISDRIHQLRKDR